MFSIIWVKWKQLMRSPWMFLGLTAAMIGFAFLVGANFSSKVEVPVFTQLSKSDEKGIIDQLNTSDHFNYVLTEKQTAIDEVVDNEAALAVQLSERGATIFRASESNNTSLVYYELLNVYEKFERDAIIMESTAGLTDLERENLQEGLNDLSKYDVFTIEQRGFQADGAFVYDSGLQGVFGFTLFFVIYTIAYNVVTILTEKKEGVWNRMMLSPLKKWEVYAGNLLYSFVLGYIQIVLVFCVFKFGLDYNFYGSFGKTLIILIPYVFSIVAISLLVAGAVKDLNQFHVVMPLVSVSMAMLGGAYWPLELVSSQLIQFIAKFVPLTYGMEALKGATVYGYDWNALLYPMGIMTLMGIVCMGIGILLFNRKET